MEMLKANETNERTAKILSEIRSIVRLQKTLSTVSLLKDVDEEIEKYDAGRKQLKSQLYVFEREMAADCETDIYVARRCRSIVQTVNKQCSTQAVGDGKREATPSAGSKSIAIERTLRAVRDRHFSDMQKDSQTSDRILRDLFEKDPKLYASIIFRVRLLESKVLNSAAGNSVNRMSAVQNIGMNGHNCKDVAKTDPWKKDLDRNYKEKSVQNFNRFRTHVLSYGDKEPTGKYKSYDIATKSWDC